MFQFRRQPLKAFYLVYLFGSLLFIRLPYWILTALPQSLRPRSKWPPSRVIILHAIRAYVNIWWGTELPPAPGQDPEMIANSPDAESLGFTWVPPLPAELIQGEVKEIMEIQCANEERTSGYWYVRQGVHGTKNRGAGSGEKAILHFHGGGYVTGSAHPKGGAIGPITDALLDALASYYYLIHTVGFQPENIIVSSDSAGGHLALNLALYIARTSLAELPVPGALLLLSPSVEWGLTHLGKDASMTRNQPSDYCGGFFEGYTKRSLLGKLPKEVAYTSVWISPASLHLPKDIIQDEFKGFPRKVYLLVGEAEICLDSYHTLKDRLLNCVGEHGLHYNEAPDSTHDFLTMPWHEPERTNALKDIASWLEVL